MERTDKVKGYCAQCGSICGTEAFVRDGRLIAVRVDRDHPNRGFCVKAEAAPEIVYNEGRAKFPMKRTNPKGAADPAGFESVGTRRWPKRRAGCWRSRPKVAPRALRSPGPRLVEVTPPIGLNLVNKVGKLFRQPQLHYHNPCLPMGPGCRFRYTYGVG